MKNYVPYFLSSITDKSDIATSLLTKKSNISANSQLPKTVNVAIFATYTTNEKAIEDCVTRTLFH